MTDAETPPETPAADAPAPETSAPEAHADAPAGEASAADGAPADTPPDRLSLDPRSPHFDGPTLQRGIGIRFKGVERTTVEEYCVSEGWVRMAVGKSRDRRGNPMTVKLAGPVEPYFLDIAGQSAG